MKRIDVLNEIEQVRVGGYTQPLSEHNRQWERYMWPRSGGTRFIKLSAAIRDNGVIVSGGGMEIKCGVLDVETAAHAVGEWCNKLSQRG